MSQKLDVLNYIRTFGSITNRDAMNDLGVSCLQERVRDLRHDGYDIKSVRETGTNRFGKPCRYVRYSL